MQLIVLNIISYQYIVHTRKSKDKVVSLKGLVYRKEACIMVRLGSLLVRSAYFLCFMQGTDGKEIPVPMSDVMERLVDLEKRLLIQEQKNVDLEGRLSEQENLNKVQWEMIQNMSPCDCKTQGKPTEYFIKDRYYLVLICSV